MKQDENESPMNYLNIHLNKGNYPQCGKELTNFSIISDVSYIGHTSQVYADMPKQ